MGSRIVSIANSDIDVTKDAAQDIFASDLIMPTINRFTYWEVFIESMDTAAVLNYTRDSTNYKHLNKNLSLVADSSYTFQIPASFGDTFNLQLSSGTAIAVKGQVRGVKI